MLCHSLFHPCRRIHDVYDVLRDISVGFVKLLAKPNKNWFLTIHMASLELILGMIGTITGVTSLIVSAYFNKKAIEQTDRNLKTQLLYEDKKRALTALRKIVVETKFRDVRGKIQTFLDAPEGTYVSQEVISGVYEDIGKVEKFGEKSSPEPKPEEPPEPEDWYSDPTEGMGEYEKYEYALNREISSFKSSAKHRIDAALKKI